MNILIQIGAGVTIALIVASVLYLFKLRQLYIIAPKMFEYGGLTGSGKIIELRVINKSRSTEEEAYINMPPSLKYDIVASDYAGVRVVENRIILDRIPPRSQISIILLLEGVLENEILKPSISSKTTKGKLFDNLEDIPPNIGDFTLIIVGALLLMFLVGFIPDAYTNIKAKHEHKKYVQLENDGWRDLDSYISSDLKDCYKNFEFPFTFVRASTINKNNRYLYSLDFTCNNKTASNIGITTYFDIDNVVDTLGLYKMPDLQSQSISQQTIGPLSSTPITVSATIDSIIPLNKIFVNFSISYGQNYVYGLRFYPMYNINSNQVLRQHILGIKLSNRKNK